MKRGLAFGFIFFLVLSFVSAGLFDWFRVQESIKITGNALLPSENAQDCVECIDFTYGIWCQDDNTCYDDPQPTCLNQVFYSEDCDGGSSCFDTCSSLGYECGSESVCGEIVDCGSCSTLDYEKCSLNKCVVDCAYYLKVSQKRVEDSSEKLSSSVSNKTCCLNSNYCVVSGSCYSSGSIYSSTGDYCYEGTWYGSLFDVTCGNGGCDSGENYGNCPSDCEGECTSSTQCPNQVCKTKSCSNYECVYSNLQTGTSCGLNGGCVSGTCVEPECSINSDCNDSDISTKDVCQNIGSYNAVCSNTKITGCIDSDGYCPSGCLIQIDNDCAEGYGDGNIDVGETCSSCPADVMCASNQECSNGKCVLKIIDYELTTSSQVLFVETEEKAEIQGFVEKTTTESEVTFTVNILNELPLGYPVLQGKRIIKILDIESSKPKINASIEFKIYEGLLYSSIDDVEIYIEGEENSWKPLIPEGFAGFSDGVYDLSVFTEHFSIFLITEPSLCGNEEFDASKEECDESVLGVEGCLNCLCETGFEPNGEGSCFEDYGGQGCPEVGEEKCSGYSYYNCSEENLWVNHGNFIGECGVECIYGDTGCEGEIPKKCDASYKWVLQEKVSGLCGYVSVRTPVVQAESYVEEEENPCSDGNCVSNENENALEEKSPSWIGWFIAGLIILIVVVAFTLIKIHNRLEEE